MIAEWLLKESVASSSAEETDGSSYEEEEEEDEHESNPIVENPEQTNKIPPQIETLSHSDSLHQNGNAIKDQTHTNEVLLH